MTIREYTDLPPLRAAAGEGTWTVRDASGATHGPLDLEDLPHDVLKAMQGHGAQVTITTALGARLVYEPYSLGDDMSALQWWRNG
jgi:hypothetical protein